jgi:hypothetical protein
MADNTSQVGTDTIATDDIGGVKYQRMKVGYGADGSYTDVDPVSNGLPIEDITPKEASYIVSITNVAGAAAKRHWDIFNDASSAFVVKVRLIAIMPVLTATVTGTISPDFDLYRTSTIGTGGTALGLEANSPPTYTRLDTSDIALPANVTIRSASTGGAASAGFIQRNFITQEESQTGAQLAQYQNILLTEGLPTARRLTLRPGQGLMSFQNTLGVAQSYNHLILITLA